MFIQLSPDCQPHLEEAADCKSFSIVGAPETAMLTDDFRVDGDYVWVDREWIAANGPQDDETWRAGFDAMLGFARGKGWIDDRGRVRGHVVRGTIAT